MTKKYESTATQRGLWKAASALGEHTKRINGYSFTLEMTTTAFGHHIQNGQLAMYFNPGHNDDPGFQGCFELVNPEDGHHTRIAVWTNDTPASMRELNR